MTTQGGGAGQGRGAASSRRRGRLLVKVQPDQGKVTIEMNRTGFRRLLDSLEALARDGGPQLIEISRRSPKSSVIDQSGGALPSIRLLMLQLSKS